MAQAPAAVTTQSALTGTPSWLDVLIGTGAQAAAADQADALAGRNLQLADLFGRIDPSMLGLEGDSYLNTLSRDTLEASLAEAQRGYALDVARFGLAQADLNFQQRTAEAEDRYRNLALQTSLRGPDNALSYNYLLNNRNAPAGTEKPYGGAGINQPSNIQPQVPQEAASTPPATPSAPTSGSGTSGPLIDTANAGGPTFAPPAAGTFSAAGPVLGGTSADATRMNELVQAGATPGQVNDLFTKAQEQSAVYAAKPPRMNRGGFLDSLRSTDGATAIVGDAPGERTGNEEMATATVTPDGRARLIVIPLNDEAPMPDKEHMAAGGVIDAPPMPTYTGGTGPASAPSRANTAYTQQDVANAPVVRQATGQESTPRFGGYAGSTEIPGTDTKLPSGAEFRYDTYADMLPSSRALLESIVSTPREQGGLGMDWQDYLESSRRGSFAGARYAPAVYG